MFTSLNEIRNSFNVGLLRPIFSNVIGVAKPKLETWSQIQVKHGVFWTSSISCYLYLYFWNNRWWEVLEGNDVNWFNRWQSEQQYALQADIYSYPWSWSYITVCIIRPPWQISHIAWVQNISWNLLTQDHCKRWSKALSSNSILRLDNTKGCAKCWIMS